MELFSKSIALVFVAIVLTLSLERHGKEFPTLLVLAVSAMIAAAAVNFLEPVMAFLTSLEKLGESNDEFLLTLLKILGIGLTGEIAAAVCNDSGISSLGKGIRMLTNSAIFYLSIPIWSSLIDLIRYMLWST